MPRTFEASALKWMDKTALNSKVMDRKHWIQFNLEFVGPSVSHLHFGNVKEHKDGRSLP